MIANIRMPVQAEGHGDKDLCFFLFLQQYGQIRADIFFSGVKGSSDGRVKSSIFAEQQVVFCRDQRGQTIDPATKFLKIRGQIVGHLAPYHYIDAKDGMDIMDSHSQMIQIFIPKLKVMFISIIQRLKKTVVEVFNPFFS